MILLPDRCVGGTLRSCLLQTIQVLLSADEQLPAGDCKTSTDGFSQMVESQGERDVASAYDDSGSVEVGDVNAAVSGNWRGVDIRDATESEGARAILAGCRTGHGLRWQQLRQAGLNGHSVGGSNRQHHKLEETIEMIKEGEMPLNSYLWIHGNAKLAPEDQTTLINWADALMKELAAKHNLLVDEKK